MKGRSTGVLLVVLGLLVQAPHAPGTFSTRATPVVPNPARLLPGDGCAAVTFALPRVYAAVCPTTDHAVADFNEDGHPDLAVADGGVVIPAAPDEISVLLNNGDGVFPAAANYFTGGPSSRVVVGDFDADGHADLFVSPQNAPGGVLLGIGDGSFQPLITNSASNARDLVVGDFNADGKLDCVVTDSFILRLYRGNGDGTFSAPVNVETGASSETSIAVGDWNGDASPDLAASTDANVVAVLLNNGDGSFQAPLDHATGLAPSSVATADLDGDGTADLAVANGASDIVSVLLGNGDGTFQAGTEYGTGDEPVSIAVGDFFAADGFLDLAVVNQSSNSVSVLLGNGNGTFQPKLDFDCGGSIPTSISASELNGDGHQDVAVTNGASCGVAVLLGDCPPIAVCGDVTMSADANCVAAASIDAGSFDTDAGDILALSQTPAGPYPVGVTLVDLTVTDPGGLTSQCSAFVTVVDDTAPTIECPADITASTDPGECTAEVSFTPVATDNCAVEVLCDPPSGSNFPRGTTTVSCSVTDAGGMSSNCVFDVTVLDTESPVVTCSVARTSLWPPDAKLLNVGLVVAATDNCDFPDVIVQVFADEDDELASGDGVFSPDAQAIAPASLRLRAERRQAGDGRVYLMVVTAIDSSLNRGVACCTVVTPKSQSTAHVATAAAQASAAEAFCLAHDGMPPPGFVMVGDGPTLGPHQ